MRVAKRFERSPGRGLEVTLEADSFDLARSGAVPLDAGIVGKLRRSSLNLDAYACRVSRVRQDTLIGWRSLEAQFGSEYGRPRDFRARFRRSLGAVLELWAGVEAEPRERGVLIRPCSPSVLTWLERCAAKGRGWHEAVTGHANLLFRCRKSELDGDTAVYSDAVPRSDLDRSLR